MGWLEQSRYVSARKEEPWGHVTLHQDDEWWSGTVYNWLGNAHTTVKKKSLGNAKAEAEKSLAQLVVPWKAWQTKHGHQDHREQARDDFVAAARALAEIEGWVWKWCPRPEDELKRDLLGALDLFGRE